MERRQMLSHFFHQIYRMLRPNKEVDTNCKYIPKNYRCYVRSEER